MKMQYFTTQMTHSNNTAAKLRVQNMAASGEFGDASSDDDMLASDNSIDSNSNEKDSVEDEKRARGMGDRVSMRYKSGGQMRKYPTVIQLKQMRMVFVGPLGEQYYAVSKPFHEQRARYTSGFSSECRPFFVHQKKATARQLRDEQFPEVGSEITVVRAIDDDYTTQCVVEGLDAKPRGATGVAVLRFLTKRWKKEG